MKTNMPKSILMLVTLTLCLAASAQDQPPPDQQRNEPAENPSQPSPTELLQRFLSQDAGGTNTLTEQAVGELIQAVIDARDALNGAKPPEGADGKQDDAKGRPIRGQGTRGTAGSGTNGQSLASLLNGSTTNHAASGKGLRLNFRNASLGLILDYLSEAAGFTISANSKVDLKGTVTVWSNQLVDRHEAIRLLNAALTASGYAATVEGNLLNIYVVDATNTEIIPGVPGNEYTNIPPTKDFVTQIVYIHNVEAGQLISSLQPLMPAGTSMSANQGANAIVITDSKANIRRMVQLVKALDTASVSASGVRVFPLTYADATALAQVVQQLFQPGTSSSQGDRGRFGGFFGGLPGGDFGRRGGDSGGSAQPGRMSSAKVVAVADDRSNSLVVSASDEQMVLVSELVSQMDVAVDDVAVLRVFRLRYADPQETADQLTSLFPDPGTQQSSRGQQFGFRGFFGGFSRGNSSSTDQDSRKIKQTRVTAVPDPRTGSVIVSAARDLMNEIAGIIEELDSDPSKKKRVYSIKVENRDPQEVVEALQSVIAADSSGNFSSTRSSASQSGGQLSTRQQNNLRNQGSTLNNNNSLNSGFGTTGGAGTTRTGR